MVITTGPFLSTRGPSLTHSLVDGVVAVDDALFISRNIMHCCAPAVVQFGCDRSLGHGLVSNVYHARFSGTYGEVFRH